MPTTPKEQRFLNALRDIFVGAPIEGDSGFINLMHIKNRYFSSTGGVLEQFQRDVNAACEEVHFSHRSQFREELFDKLYSFFYRYFSESGSLYFRYTHLRENLYERVYSDKRDVSLFWKTHQLYYVKTDRLFQSMTVNLAEVRGSALYNADDLPPIFFDVSALETKKNNEKRALVYEVASAQANAQASAQAGDDGKTTLTLRVQYAERGKTNDFDDAANTANAALQKAKKPGERVGAISAEHLERAVRIFEKQAEVDFFINKDARAFLREQFDLWAYQYIFRQEFSDDNFTGANGNAPETAWTQERIRQIQIIKRLAFRLIDFIAQFEDELKKIWLKPKFARNAHYIISLNRLVEAHTDTASGLAFVRELLADAGASAQMQEWLGLGMTGEHFSAEQIFTTHTPENTMFGEPQNENNAHESQEILHPQWHTLPLDTKHFPRHEARILALFDHLDNALDGRLIHSENFQALQTLHTKYREQVKCIYIDPPYNTGPSEIFYENDYKNSSWLTLMHNRLERAKEFLKANGVLVVAIDESEQEKLGLLLKSLFPDNAHTCITVVHNPSGQQGDNFSYTHEYAYFVYPSKGDTIGLSDRSDNADIRPLRDVSKGNHLRTDAANCFYPILVQDDAIIGFGDVCPDDFHPSSANVYREDGIIEIYPIDAQGEERKWVFARQTVESILDELSISYNVNRGIYDVIRTKTAFTQKTVWTDKKYSANSYGAKILNQILGDQLFSFPKSIHTVTDCITASLNGEQTPLILDFFGGSGTTAHAVMKLNAENGGGRKFLVIEMAEYFHTVILPRVKKAAFSLSWRAGKAVFQQAKNGKNASNGASPNTSNGAAHEISDGAGVFCKYMALEQYEDTLRKVRYDTGGEVLRFGENADANDDYIYNRYVFLSDEKLLEAIELDRRENRVKVDFTRLYDDVDIAETLSNLLGSPIRRITPESVTLDDGTAEGETLHFDALDFVRVKPLLWW
jgi:adenine-specific DNA-methyltransferase